MTVIGKNLERQKRKMASESGTAYVYFADLKAAFDNVDRKKILRMMEELELDRESVREIYSEMRTRIVIKDGVLPEFWTGKGMRQR